MLDDRIPVPPWIKGNEEKIWQRDARLPTHGFGDSGQTPQQKRAFYEALVSDGLHEPGTRPMERALQSLQK